jgi:hypothetical protein
MSDSDFKADCAGDLGAGSFTSARNIVCVAFRQEVFEKEIETGVKKDVLLRVKINEISSSLSPFSPLVCYVYRVHGTAA